MKLIFPFVLIIGLFCSVVSGQTPADYPGEGTNSGVSWLNYTLANGNPIQDDLTDIGTAELNIVYSSAAPSSVSIAYDGTNAFFRLQLEANPTAGGNISNSQTYLAELAAADGTTEGTAKAIVGVNGKTNPDKVYVTDISASTVNDIYIGTGFRGVAVSGSSPQTYWLEFQVPISAIQAIWPGFTETTQMKVFYGTSNNLNNINKDYMTGTTVNFALVSTSELASIEEGSLPVELTSFTSKSSNNGVSLSWTTATEIDNYGFEIEKKSQNMFEWKKIGFIEGSGYSNSPKYYSFFDHNPPYETVQYRLKQIDTDGKYKFSNIINVEAIDKLSVQAKFALEQNYPNPFNPNTTISYSIPEKSNVELKIYNILGKEVAQLVNEIQESGSHNIQFNAEKLSSGAYFYRLTAGQFVETRKFLFLK